MRIKTWEFFEPTSRCFGECTIFYNYSLFFPQDFPVCVQKSTTREYDRTLDLSRSVFDLVEPHIQACRVIVSWLRLVNELSHFQGNFMEREKAHVQLLRQHMLSLRLMF